MDKINELDEKIERIRFYKLLGRTVYITIFCLLIALVLWICSNSMMMQKDTLNTLNDQQQEMNDLSVRITNVELLCQTEQKQAETVQKVPLTTSERELIERTCMAESNTIDGMMAVAQVVHNRAILWNKTPYEVVTQGKQFAEPAKGEISAEAVQAVWAVFDENMKAFEDNNVTHFYAEDSREPYWTDNKTFVGSRGGNRFYESKY